MAVFAPVEVGQNPHPNNQALVRIQGKSTISLREIEIIRISAGKSNTTAQWTIAFIGHRPGVFRTTQSSGHCIIVITGQIFAVDVGLEKAGVLPGLVATRRSPKQHGHAAGAVVGQSVKPPPAGACGGDLCPTTAIPLPRVVEIGPVVATEQDRPVPLGVVDHTVTVA